MGNILAFARDSLTSFVSRMGTDRDKAATTFYTQPVLTDEQIVAAYRGSWLPRKIVDIPALDSCRKWRDWQADPKEIEVIEKEEKRLNVKGKVLEASKKGRLFGGAALFIGTDQDPAQPLEVERISKGGIKYLTVMTRRQLKAGEIERDPESEWFGKPKSYTLSGANGLQMEIHPSRLVLFSGAMAPDEDISTAINQGWGESVLTATLDAIKNADGTAANVASLIFEAKIDVIKIPNFMSSIGDEVYKTRLLERYTLAATAKGINGMLLLDAEEEYESKSTSFATLPDVMMSFMQIVSGAADIPVTRLLGQAPAGLNATGTSDMKNYHDRVQSIQELELTPALMRLDECIIRSAMGTRDEAIYYEWAPLEQMSEKEKAEIFKTKADAARALAGTGTSPELMPILALSDALVNTLTEDGSLPGLDGFIKEYGKLSEQEPSEEEIEAATSVRGNSQQTANDAAPKTLYVRRDVINAAEITAWAEAQGMTDILPDLHVTIVYSRTPIDWIKAGNASEWSVERDGRMIIPAGGPRVVEPLGGMTAVLMFASSMLSWRHREILEAGAEHDFDDYQVHISLTKAAIDVSKVEPYRGRIILGPEVFEEVKEDAL